MSKLSEALRDVGVYNDHGFFNEQGQVWIGYQAKSGGPFSSRAFVYRRGYKTCPDAHWSDNGNMAFSGYGAPRPEGVSQRAHCIALAQEWASERYGITEWQRAPTGGIGDARFVKARLADLKAQLKAAGRA